MPSCPIFFRWRLHLATLSLRSWVLSLHLWCRFDNVPKLSVNSFWLFGHPVWTKTYRIGLQRPVLSILRTYKDLLFCESLEHDVPPLFWVVKKTQMAVHPWEATHYYNVNCDSATTQLLTVLPQWLFHVAADWRRNSRPCQVSFQSETRPRRLKRTIVSESSCCLWG